MSGGNGPCGACKFLRRKCVKGCVFAPYFAADQTGTAHFAAVHKVFGASNASKMLAAVPVNRRVEAVISLCYEALARVTDPVYGCVPHIFTLQQQVVTLQAELAYVQARLSTLHHLPPPSQPPPPATLAGGAYSYSPSSTLYVDHPPPLDQAAISMDGDDDEEHIHMLAWELVSRHLPGSVRFRP